MTPPAADNKRRGPLLAVVALLVLGLVGAAVAGGASFGPDAPTAGWLAPASAGAPSGAPKPSAPEDDGTITLAGVGDVIMGSAPGDLPPGGGKGFFDRVRTSLKADLVMGNLETPLSGDTGYVKCGWETPTPGPGNPSPSPRPAANCHQFSLPTSYAGHLKDAGFGVMNLANNHTFDMGRAGLDNTRKALEKQGIAHTGAPGQITYRTVKGVKVAVIGFSIYGWTQSLNDISGSASLVRKAAKNADIVVLQMQGGAEGSDKQHVKRGHEIFAGEDRGDLITFTHKMIDAGADVVFGHGPHIMRGMEFYKGRLIAYSLGNFCGYRVLRGTGYLGVGGILKVRLKPDGTWVSGTLVPTEMVNGGYPAVDKEKRALSFVNGLSEDDFGDNAARIDKSGKITPLSP
ncbi:CapA family protein [Luedemannella helvata]|uniref:CapA family protein n=1 Tax=Luedemannella helvata TaxID=349315 RepID=UPI003CD052E3